MQFMHLLSVRHAQCDMPSAQSNIAQECNIRTHYWHVLDVSVC